MAETQAQGYRNHARWVPFYHFVISTILLPKPPRKRDTNARDTQSAGNFFIAVLNPVRDGGSARRLV